MARRLTNIAIVLAATALIIVLRLLDPQPVTQMRLAVFDLYQRIQPRPYEAAPVRIVDIDDESLTRVGQWPWPRTAIAGLVERLSELGAATIAFAVVFAEPDRTTPHRVMKIWPRSATLDRLARELGDLPDHDAVLADVLSSASSAPTVLGFTFSQEAASGSLPVKFGFAFSGPDPASFLPGYRSVIGNLAILETAASGLGALTIRLDPDGTVRRLALVARTGNRIHPSLGLEAIRTAQGASTLQARSAGDGGLVGTDAALTDLRVGRIAIPTGPEGEIWLHYTDDVPERTVPAWRVLQERDSELSSLISGHIVLVGVSASGLQIGKTTPLNPAETAAAIHAQAVEQMLLGHFLTRPDWASGAEVLALLILCNLLAWLIIVGRRAAIGVLASATIASALWITCWLAYARAGMLFDPLYATFSIVLIYILVSSLQYIASERDRRHIRMAFGRYLAPAIVERLAENPENLVLGGETRDLTVMFCDIRGFTAIAEGMAAEELTQFINRFLTPMSEVILETGGTIDKYMGDAIMAFWNAPLPEPRHGLSGSQAALEMCRRLMVLTPAWREEAMQEGKEFQDIHIGIGLNSGPCCVGNLGSEQRFDYSALGDTVNIASRLEQQTRIYGLDIIVGENTRRLAAELAYLELDRIQVRGRSATMTIFALMGDEWQAKDADFVDLRTRHGKALAAYRRQDWDEAELLFEDCRERWGGKLDDLYATYAIRLSALRRYPPGDGWDGVFQQTPR